MTASNCPSDDILKSLLVGHLPQEECRGYESHIMACAECGVRTRQIQTSDPLLDLLPSVRDVPWSDADELESRQMVERFSGRSQLLARTSNGASLETESGAPKAQDGRQTAAETPTHSSLAASGLTTIAGTPGQVSRGGDSAHTLVLPVGEGVTLGVYRLEEKLGEGGMGTVWKAFHTRLKKPVAVKVLSAHLLRNASLVARFEREMEAVGKLDHPVIVRAMDAGEIDRTHYLVMEYVEGTDFGQLVKAKGARTVRDACEMIRQAAVGLAYAHQNGLVHRDIKPTNLFLTKQGKVKVLDLGLARLQGEGLADEGGDHLTNPGQILGTPDFMAPEQWENTHTAGPACDLYALGCTLFFLLTGRAPFADERHPTLARKMLGHCEHTPPSLSVARAALMAKARQRPSAKTSGETAASLTHDIPPELEAIYEKLLAKSPADRFPAAEHLASALAEILKTGPLAPAKPAPPHAKEPLPASPKTDSAPPVRPRNVASRPKTAPNGPPAQSRRILRTMFGGLAAAFLLGVIVITIKNKDGSVKTLEVDDSAEISMSRQERSATAAVPVPSAPVPRPTGWVAEVPPPEIDYAAERKAAEGLIELRTRRQIRLDVWLRAAGSTSDFDLPQTVEALPEGQFTINGMRCGSERLKDDDLAAIARCQTLESLRLVSCHELTAAGLRQLGSLKSLQVLKLDDCKDLGDGIAPLIAANPNLRDVTVDFVESTSDLTAALLGCHRLQKLAVTARVIKPALYPGLAEQCRDLESLLVSESHGVDLPALASLPRLKTLRITGAHLTPERREASLAALQAMPALESLDCCPPMSDDYLALLTPLGKKLRHLEVNSWFGWDPGVTAAGWKSIKEFHALESLVIRGLKSQVDGPALQWMATLPSLRSLNVGLDFKENRLYSEADVAEFHKRRPDVQLTIDGTQYQGAATNTNIDWVAEVPPTEIDYAAERKAAEGWIELLTRRQIKLSVWLRSATSGAQFSLPQSTEALPADAFTVSGIRWYAGGLEDADLAAIARCRQLEQLHIIECLDFTDAGLSQLRPLKNLKVLEINGCKQLGPGVAPLIAANPNLNVVMVDWSGEAMDLEEAILGCRHLRKLSVAETAITSALYPALAEHCPDLETLLVSDPRVVDLPALVSLPRLNTLRISGEHLTPERREASFAALLAMPALETLDCCPPMSDDYLAQLTLLGKKLRHLEVNSWTDWDPGISVLGWKSIEKFESLESLTIRGQMSKLDGPALMWIAHLPALRALEVQLDIKENRLYTEADVAEFQKRRPDIDLRIHVGEEWKHFPVPEH